MIVTGLTEYQLTQALRRASKNLRFNRFDQLSKSGLRFQLSLKVKASGRIYAKRSIDRYGQYAKGYRRTNSVCYHGHYAFMQECFKINPDAKIYTSMAKYTSFSDFASKAPALADANIGSMMYPVAFCNSCGCSEAIRHKLNLGF